MPEYDSRNGLRLGWRVWVGVAWLRQQKRRPILLTGGATGIRRLVWKSGNQSRGLAVEGNSPNQSLKRSFLKNLKHLSTRLWVSVGSTTKNSAASIRSSKKTRSLAGPPFEKFEAICFHFKHITSLRTRCRLLVFEHHLNWNTFFEIRIRPVRKTLQIFPELYLPIRKTLGSPHKSFVHDLANNASWLTFSRRLQEIAPRTWKVFSNGQYLYSIGWHTCDSLDGKPARLGW